MTNEEEISDLLSIYPNGLVRQNVESEEIKQKIYPLSITITLQCILIAQSNAAPIKQKKRYGQKKKILKKEGINTFI